MEVARPSTLAEAAQVRAEHPDLIPICGGTDLMVSVNFGRLRPAGLLDLTRVAELGIWCAEGEKLVLGAGVTWSRVLTELAPTLPGLALAARTVGSPQIRNTATVGGNLGTASPAGDAHPVLLACGASVELVSVRGSRVVPVREFFTGVKSSVRQPDELIAAVHLPLRPGAQQFAKIGSRNAMVIAVTAFGLDLDLAGRRVGTGIGSAGPTPLVAFEAEEFLSAELDWDGRKPVQDNAIAEFGRLVAAAARPIDDVRGTADYRRHALSVLAGRTLRWAWAELSTGAGVSGSGAAGSSDLKGRG